MTSQLFSPIKLRSLELPNRIVVAPMCQYSAHEGTVGDWHLMHLGQFAVGGAALTFVEASGVEAAGRISPGCVGLYSDENEAALARIVRFYRDYGSSRIGIQLAHAGRKASTGLPWNGGAPLKENESPWETVAPSAMAYGPGWHTPRALDEAGLASVRDAFVQAAERARNLDFDALEVHCAHGYLLHQFLSPISNRRNDAYGGELENRMRFPLEVFDAVRAVWPGNKPLGVRFSATDWIENGWNLESSIAFSLALKERGCDFFDASSGGLAPEQQIVSAPGYQTGFAAEVRRATGVATLAVGRITEPHQAETIITSGQPDMVVMARGMLYDPRWPWHAAQALGEQAAFPPQYMRAHPSMQGLPVPGNPPPPK